MSPAKAGMNTTLSSASLPGLKTGDAGATDVSCTGVPAPIEALRSAVSLARPLTHTFWTMTPPCLRVLEIVQVTLTGLLPTTSVPLRLPGSIVRPERDRVFWSSTQDTLDV